LLDQTSPSSFTTSTLLKLRYNNALHDAMAELGDAVQVL
jgi:hypothetical protein